MPDALNEERRVLMTEHNHDHDHDHTHDMEDEEIIVLKDEDGKEHNFILGEIITVEETDYAILLPVDEEVEEGVIFRIDEEDGDQMVLSEIEDDAEWEKVVTAYNELDEEDTEDYEA
jgi:uncharacterized protein YrzB (UPF0473 family)